MKLTEDGSSDSGRSINRVSVVIANYNQGSFLAQAIDSALGLDWPDVEVIVVDDGSTDTSREVLARYLDKVEILYQPNRTQRIARNRGYELVTGDVVIHLDADDVLDRTLIRRVAPIWRDGISKVQVQMKRINAAGTPTGGRFPKFGVTPTPSQIRHWFYSTGAYPTPPGSGNVYSRIFLDKLFPIDDRCGPATDSACIAAAPVLGDVLTVPEPLVSYRVHPQNTSNLLAARDQFARAIERAVARQQFASDLMGSTNSRVDILRSNRSLLQLRVASSRMTPQLTPLTGDSRSKQTWDVVSTLLKPGPETLAGRLLNSAWCLLILTAPSKLVPSLLRLRYRRR